MSIIALSIDRNTIQVTQGATILQAAQAAGIYVPTLCAHPELVPEGECGICTVEAGGELLAACAIKAVDGMVVRTDTDRVKEIRKGKLSAILLNHPHACLTCAQKAGCSRTQCSSNVAVNERCCRRLGNCEIERLVEYIGLREDLGRYVYRDLPRFDKEPLFTRDYNLCIGCRRCLRACKDLRGVDALEAYEQEGRSLVKAKAVNLADSGCKFCTACVEVCPTGALLDKDLQGGDRAASLVPCTHRCPASIDIPRYLGYVAGGNFDQALAVVREKVPFPATLGRVCFHPCEQVCRRGQVNEPVAICRLKRSAADFGGTGWKKGRKPAPATNKKVAVIGSGPAGLTAANYLALKGHGVTVYEAEPQAGGMLRLGIPDYRLPPSVLDEEITAIRETGVEIKTGHRIEALEGLFKEGHQAVFVAIGAHKSSALGMPGEDSPGVLEGVAFLRAVSLREKYAIGKRVAVVGGGNVAMDAARTAVRLGAEEVTVLYRRTREELPAHGEEVAEALHEGVKLEFLTIPVKITPRDSGLQVECRRTELGEPDAGGRCRPVPVPGSEYSLSVDNLIIAIGQSPDIPEGFGLRVNQGTLQVSPENLAAGKPGVFAGGDAVLGPASVIEAIAQGRKAASAIDGFLGGDGDLRETLVEYQEPNPWIGRDEDFAGAGRAGSAKRPWQKSTQRSCSCECPPEELLDTAFVEVEVGMFAEMANDEAARCLNCHLRLQIREVPRPPDKWLKFNAETVARVPAADGVFQLLDGDKNVFSIVGTPNLREALKEQLDNPKACYFGYAEDPMFTQRESQLIQQYLQEHGKLPEGSDNLDDLF